MPSPFPGMNPFIENDDVWMDFHNAFILTARNALVGQAGPEYIVKVEQQVYIHEVPDEGRTLLGRSDVSVAGMRDRPRQEQSGAATLDAPAYAWLPPSVDFERQSFLEIRDRRSRDLVTVLELLSPTNKRPGPDREQYLAKRRQFLYGNVHFVEIDLLRGGPRLPLEELPSCDYYVMVSRVSDRPRVGLWPVMLREKLPDIPVPLLPPDPDARLDIQAIVHQVYDSAGYAHHIYSNQPQPPLSPADAEWVQSVLHPRV
jgi:hypothetical protein